MIEFLRRSHCSSAALAALISLLPIGLPPALAAFLTTNTSVETTIEAGNVGTNRGNDFLVVGNTGGPGLRRSLISFGDVEGLIGPNREIIAATMTLTVENMNGAAPGHLIGVFSVLRPWTEGIGTGASGGSAPSARRGTPLDARATTISAKAYPATPMAHSIGPTPAAISSAQPACRPLTPMRRRFRRRRNVCVRRHYATARLVRGHDRQPRHDDRAIDE